MHTPSPVLQSYATLQAHCHHLKPDPPQRPVSAAQNPPQKQTPKVTPRETPPTQTKDSISDSMMKWIGTGVNGANGIGTAITLPNEMLKVADTLGDAAKALSQRGHLLKSLQKTPLASIGTRATTGTVKLLEKSTHLSKIANSVMNTPVVGRLTQPHVADFVTDKVLPTANALASGITIYDHSRRFQKARSENNTAGQVLSGVQIGLNAVCAVTGYMKGHGQTVSAVAGLGSMALDIGSWATGIGHVKLE